MATKQIKKYEDDVCRHPEHKPPMFKVYLPGEYEHTCPACGHITKFTVPLITY